MNRNTQTAAPAKVASNPGPTPPNNAETITAIEITGNSTVAAATPTNQLTARNNDRVVVSPGFTRSERLWWKRIVRVHHHAAIR